MITNKIKYFAIKRIKKIKKYAKKILMGEKHTSYGSENPDKTYYVIRSASSVVGLYSYVLTFSGRIKEAISRNMVPIIDMQSIANPYLEETQVGKVNAWELYFDQPGGYRYVI